ncbi:MAG: hypothetical protein IIA11_08400, partial [Proteobacteria bacterium]|nr:hypothetical protein [Pseudomonadota bacterium]
MIAERHIVDIDDIDELSREIASAGFSVQSVLCGNPDAEDGRVCPHFGECNYQMQRLALGGLSAPPDQPLIFVLSHAYMASWPRFLPPPDLKIIDESCWQQFVQKSKLQLTDLQRIAKGAPKETQHILQSIAAALGAGAPLLKTLRGMGLTQRNHFKAAKSWLTNQIQAEANRLVKTSSPNFRKLQPWVATSDLVNQLSREIEIDRAISHSVSFPDCESPNTKHQIGIYFRRSPEQQIPVMLLDASADSDINSRIWGGKFETHTVNACRNAKIYQVRRKSFSRQSITGEDAFGNPLRPEEAAKLRRDILQFVTARLQHHSRIFVVAQLRVSAVLEGPLQPYIDADRIRMTHFCAFRGLNTFEDCDAAIIIGREQPSPGAVEALARALYWDDRKPLLLGLGYARMLA